MENLFVVAGQVMILFVLMGLGAALRQARLIGEGCIDGLVNLLMLIVVPCLVMDVFQRPFSPSMLTGIAFGFVISVACHVMLIVISSLCVHHPDENVRKPLRLAAVFSNAGFIGIPLEQAVLGDAGVFFGVVYIVVFNLVMWSWGLRTMCGGKGTRGADAERIGLKMFVNPGTIGIALGLPLFLTSTALPDILRIPVHLVAGLNTPLAMIVIGYCLWGAKLGRVARMTGVYVAAFLRLVVSPLLVVAVLYPFRHQLDRSMMLAVCIAASAPVGAMVSMFASKFKRDVDTSVAIVSGTTLLSILTMPVVIAFAMSVL